MKVNKRRPARINKRAGAIIALSIALVLTLCVGYLGFNGAPLDSRGLNRLLSWIPQAGAGNWPASISLGGTLAGGTYAEYDIVVEEEGAQVEDSLLDRTVEMMRTRLASQGYADSTVSRLGPTGVRVEIPAGSNQDRLLALISAQGKLEFLDAEENVFMDGSHVQSAQAVYDNTGAPAVSLTFDGEGTEIFYDMTAKSVGEVLTITMDGETLMSATVSEAIRGGLLISGSFTVEDVANLVMVIRSGVLPVEFLQDQQGSFPAPIGADALSSWVTAVFVAIVLVMLVLMLRYRLGGLVASWGIALYVILFFLLLGALPGVPLTFPGIAGVILALCLALGAAVTTLEQVKGEVQEEGRPMAHAVRIGFEDAGKTVRNVNIAAALLSVALLFLGSAAVQSFAAMLLIGAVLGMVTSLAMTRWLFIRFVRVINAPGLYVANAKFTQDAEITNGEAK